MPYSSTIQSPPRRGHASNTLPQLDAPQPPRVYRSAPAPTGPRDAPSFCRGGGVRNGGPKGRGLGHAQVPRRHGHGDRCPVYTNALPIAGISRAGACARPCSSSTEAAWEASVRLGREKCGSGRGRVGDHSFFGGGGIVC